MKVPFFSTRGQEQLYGPEIREAIDRVIRSGSFILGEEVQLLEKSLAKFCDVKHVIGVGNASDALFLAVRAAKLHIGSEVLTTPYTFFASSSCIVRNGLKPVFVDIDEDTFHINTQNLDRYLTAKTSAILSVDLFSHPSNSNQLFDYAKKNNLKLIEDSAEAFGMRWRGKHAGTTGVAGVLSFFPTKTLGCFGDGGAVITNDDSVAYQCRLGRVHGTAKKYHHEFIGINSRLDELQAAVLNVKFKYIAEEIGSRNRAAKRYFEGLSNLDQIKLPYVPLGADAVWYVFAPRFHARDDLASFLMSRGIGSSIYWPKPLHLQPCFSDLGYKKGDFPRAERLCTSTLALPIFPGIEEKEIDYVINSIKDFYKNG